MKSLAFFALSAIATAAMAGPVPAPMGTITISGNSSQTLSVNGGYVANMANPYSYANQNIASNKGNITISGSSTQSSTLTGANVTNEAKLNGDVAVQNLASNVGSVDVKTSPSVAGSSMQTANVDHSNVTNQAKGYVGCRGSDCADAALAYQNVASNMGNVTISGHSTQSASVSGNSTLNNLADGAKTMAVQNVASNYGNVMISGNSTQIASISGNALVVNQAKGNSAHAAQNLASNDSCLPPPPICVGPACGPYAFNTPR